MTQTTLPPDSGEASLQNTLNELRALIEQRIRAEARRSRRVRFLAWTALLLSIAALGSTAALLYYAFHQDLPLLTSSSLRTEEIVLVDGAGVERGYWTVEDGAARIVLLDPRGAERMKLTVRSDGEQGLSMADEGGANRVVLGFLADQSSSLAFADSDGTTRAVLGMSGGDATSLLFADANGGARAALGLTAAGEPSFWWPEVEEADAADTAASGSP